MGDIETGNNTDKSKKSSFKDFLNFYHNIISKIRLFVKVLAVIVFILVVICGASFCWLSIIAAHQGYDQKYPLDTKPNYEQWREQHLLNFGEKVLFILEDKPLYYESKKDGHLKMHNRHGTAIFWGALPLMLTLFGFVVSIILYVATCGMCGLSR